MGGGERERQTDRQTDRQRETERQRKTETEKETEKGRDREELTDIINDNQTDNDHDESDNGSLINNCRSELSSVLIVLTGHPHSAQTSQTEEAFSSADW